MDSPLRRLLKAALKRILTKVFMYRFIVFSTILYLAISNYHLSKQSQLIAMRLSVSSINHTESVLSVVEIRLQKVRTYPNLNDFSLQQILPMRKSQSKKDKCKGLVKWIITPLMPKQTVKNVEALLRFASHDWCILVINVGDQTNLRWTKNKRLIYLTTKQLSSFPFKVAKINSAALSHKKNIAFLYAIHSGAQTILDMEGDLVPTGINGQYLPVIKQATEFKDSSLPSNFSGKLWNPSSLLGMNNSSPNNRLNDKPVTTRKCLPVVQQYLISSFPSGMLDSKPWRPVAVPPGMYAPNNASATVHLYDALWSLLIPPTPNANIVNTIRSLVAQHILNFIPGTCIVFTPAALHRYSKENHHTLSISSNQRNTSKVMSAALVAELLDQSSQHSFYKLSIYLTYVQLYEYGVLDIEDVDYVKAWLTDLKQIEYHFPSRKWQPKSWTTNVQLCIMFNLKDMSPNKASVNMLLSYYLQFFRHILVLFDGDWPHRPNYIPPTVAFSGCRSEHGWYQHICLNTCLQQSKKTSGYLYIADDMFVNFTMMSSFSTSKLWYIKPQTVNFTRILSDHPTDWHWGAPHYFENALQTVFNTLPEEWMSRLIDYGGYPDHLRARAIFDIIYIPQRLVKNITNVLTHFIKTAVVFGEIAGPLAVEIVVPQFDRETLKYGYLWKQKRSISFIQDISDEASFVHPIKLAGNPAEARLWKQMMDNQLFSLIVHK